MIKDNEFDLNAQEIDSFCASHDVDDYDLFGEIMVGDDNSDCDIDFDYTK